MPEPTAPPLEKQIAAAAIPPAPGEIVTPAAPTPAAAPVSPMEEAFAVWDKKFGAEPAPEPPKPAEKPPAEPPKKPGEKPGETPPAAEAKKPPETPAKAAETPGKPKRPSDYLREELAKTKAERDSFRAEVEVLKKAKPTEDPEKKTLSEDLQKERQRREQLEERLKFTDFAQSDEFQEKYYKPFVDAFNKGRAKTASFTVTTGEGVTRKATPEDFDAIMALSDAEAAEKATELFGERAANLILWHRENVLAAHDAQQRVLEEYRKTGADRQKQTNEQRLAEAKKANEMWNFFNKKWSETHPEWYKPVEGDAEGNKLLEDGFKEADLAFNIPKDMPMEMQVALHSKIRNQAAAFPRLVHQLVLQNARIAELEAELDKFEESVPGTAEGAKPPSEPQGQASDMDGVLSTLDKIAKPYGA